MKRLATSGYFLVMMAALGFSFKSILVKAAYGYGVEPMTLMLMRIFIALPLYIVTLLIVEGRSAFTVSARELLLFAFMGITGIGCAMLFSFYSLELIDASLATLVVYTYPAMTVVLLIIFFGERATAAKFVSLSVTFLGLIMVVRVDRVDYLNLNGKGILFGLVAAFAFALYNAMSERAVKSVSPVRLISYCMFFFVAFFGILFGNRAYPDAPEVWGLAAILGLFTGFIPFLCLLYGIKRIGAGKAVIIGSLGPLFTVLWAFLLLGERLDTIQIGGMVVAITGVMALRLGKPEAVRARVE
ncbi:MAG: DMT family transporter [Deltaproteobacteria bacterium]|nr:DMT family transporter [Deltaproteobacteria bacterium]